MSRACLAGHHRGGLIEHGAALAADTPGRAALIEPGIVVRLTTLNAILQGDHVNGEQQF